MLTNYYLPLEFDKIINKKRNPVCGEEDSIKQFLNLMLTTYLGEYRYEPQFGCRIWDLNYNNIHSVNKWKEMIKKEVTKSILNNENRLKNIEVQITLVEPNISTVNKKVIKSRQKILITIGGTMVLTNKNFYHQEVIFFSPLSIV